MSRRTRYTRNLGRPCKAPLPVRTTRQWIRFEHEYEPFGIFSYPQEADAALDEESRKEIKDLYKWFCRHLHSPKVDGIERFWFCAEASQYISRAQRIAALLRLVGIPIVERRSSRIPGKVRWEDRHQVAVLTYRDSPQPKRKN